MKTKRWTAGDVKLQAEGQLAAERLAVAEIKLKKLQRLLYVVGGLVLPGAILAGLVRIEAGAIAGATGVIGLSVCLYYWSAARQQAHVARAGIENNKSERKNWARQRPKEMA